MCQNFDFFIKLNIATNIKRVNQYLCVKTPISSSLRKKIGIQMPIFFTWCFVALVSLDCYLAFITLVPPIYGHRTSGIVTLPSF